MLPDSQNKAAWFFETAKKSQGPVLCIYCLDKSDLTTLKSDTLETNQNNISATNLFTFTTSGRNLTGSIQEGNQICIW